MKGVNLNTVNKYISQDVIFRGYNNTLAVKNGESSDEYGCCSESFPVLKGWKGINGYNKVTGNENKCNGIYAMEKLAYVLGSNLYYGDTLIPEITLTDDEKTMIGFGAYLLIFPDKKFLNTHQYFLDEEDRDKNISLYGSLDNIIYVPVENFVHIKNIQASDNDEIPLIDYTEIKFVEDSVDLSGFRKGDVIEITEFARANWEGYYEIEYITENAIYLAPNLFGLEVNKEVTGASIAAYGNIIFSRKMPDLELFGVNGNRLWGCAKEKTNEGYNLWCAKSNDPFNWYYYSNDAGNSYVTAVAEPGDFTGCIGFQNNIIFSKEDNIYEVYGYKPSNFNLIRNGFIGVEKGSERSVVICNERLFYKSRIGIMRFTGGIPICISETLNGNNYKNAVAGTDGKNLWVCMTDPNNNRILFNYDIANEIWHKIGNFDIKQFAYYNGKLYGIYKDNIIIINDAEYRQTWEWESGDIEYNSFNKKELYKIQIRCEVPLNSYLDIFVSYNNEKFNILKRIEKTGKRVLSFNIRVKRCDHLKIKLHSNTNDDGGNTAIVYGLSYIYRIGTDVRGWQEQEV